MASCTRIITNQEKLDSRTRDNGPIHEGSHTRDNTLHYQNASNYRVMMKSNKECSTKLSLVYSHAQSCFWSSWESSEEESLIFHVFIFLRWVWINVNNGGMLSSSLPGRTISHKVSILITFEVLDLWLVFSMIITWSWWSLLIFECLTEVSFISSSFLCMKGKSMIVIMRGVFHSSSYKSDFLLGTLCP